MNKNYDLEKHKKGRLESDTTKFCKRIWEVLNSTVLYLIYPEKLFLFLKATSANTINENSKKSTLQFIVKKEKTLLRKTYC